MTKKHCFPFSGKLYLQTLKRLRIVGIALYLSALGLNFAIKVTGPDSGAWLFTAVLIAAQFIVPFSAFSFLFDRTKSDMFDSLPVSKLCVFITTYAAQLTIILGLLLFGAFTNRLMFLNVPMYRYLDGNMFRIMLYLAAASFAMSGAAVLAASLAGTRFSAYVCFLSLAFFVYGAAPLAETVVKLYIPLLYVPDTATAGLFAGLMYWLFGSSIMMNYYYVPKVLLYTCLGAALTVCACLLFTKRKSETAEKAAAGSAAQTVLRIFAALPTAVFASMAAISVSVSHSVSADGVIKLVQLCILTLAVYYVYELITQKSLKKALKATKQLPILVGICAALVLAVVGVRAAVYSVCPTADEIESVTLEDGIVVTNENAVDYVASQLKAGIDGSFDPYTFSLRSAVKIKLKNGRTYTRNIMLNNFYLKAAANGYDDSVMPYHNSYTAKIGWNYNDLHRYQSMTGRSFDRIDHMIESELKLMTREEVEAFWTKNQCDLDDDGFCICLLDTVLTLKYDFIKAERRDYICLKVPVDFYDVRQKMIDEENSTVPADVTVEKEWTNRQYTDDRYSAIELWQSYLENHVTTTLSAEEYANGHIYDGGVFCTKLRLIMVNAAENSELSIELDSEFEDLYEEAPRGSARCSNGEICRVIEKLNALENAGKYPDAHGCYAYIYAEFSCSASDPVRRVNAVISLSDSDYAVLAEFAENG